MNEDSLLGPLIYDSNIRNSHILLLKNKFNMRKSGKL